MKAYLSHGFCWNTEPTDDSGIPANFEKVAGLIALVCSTPPEGHARWTLRLLEEKVAELKIVEFASDNMIGQTLAKKTCSNPTSRSNGSAET